MSDLTVVDTNGNPTTLNAYAGQVILVVNTASRCAYTKQLGELQTIYEKYRERGFVVLAFPCNDFGNQEPQDNAGAKAFCQLNFRTTFPFFGKVKILRWKADEPFAYIFRKLGFASRPFWNFNKYLIARDGMPAAFFYGATKPSSKKITTHIEKLLSDATC